jgi:hypothetical protein
VPEIGQAPWAATLLARLLPGLSFVQALRGRRQPGFSNLLVFRCYDERSPKTYRSGAVLKSGNWRATPVAPNAKPRTTLGGPHFFRRSSPRSKVAFIEVQEGAPQHPMMPLAVALARGSGWPQWPWATPSTSNLKKADSDSEKQPGSASLHLPWCLSGTRTETRPQHASASLPSCTL